MPPPNARITPTAETMPPQTAPRSSRHRKARPRDACCSKRAEAVPSQSKRAPSGTRAGQSRSEIAPNGTKGCVSPNGAMHAMGRRDAPSEAKRHDAGRRGVSAANRAGSPMLTPQPSLAATKHTRTKPCPPEERSRAQRRNKPTRPARKQTARRGQRAGFAVFPQPTSGIPCVNAAAVLGCDKTRRNKPARQQGTPPNQTQPNQPQNESQQ